MSSMTAARTTSSAGAAAASRRRGVHLTPRGRGVLLLVLVGLLLTAFALGRSASSQATAAAPHEPVLTALTVQPGDTLWSLARRLDPDRDRRDLVAQIARLNDLPIAGLQAGQQLVLPAAA